MIELVPSFTLCNPRMYNYVLTCKYHHLCLIITSAFSSFYCLYTWEQSTFLPPLKVAASYYYYQKRATHCKSALLPLNFDGLATVCPFCWETEMVPQLIKGISRSQPTTLQTMRSHKWTTSKSTPVLIWVKLLLPSRIVLKVKSEALLN